MCTFNPCRNSTPFRVSSEAIYMYEITKEKTWTTRPSCRRFITFHTMTRVQVEGVSHSHSGFNVRMHDKQEKIQLTCGESGKGVVKSF